MPGEADVRSKLTVALKFCRLHGTPVCDVPIRARGVVDFSFRCVSKLRDPDDSISGSSLLRAVRERGMSDPTSAKEVRRCTRQVRFPPRIEVQRVPFGRMASHISFVYEQRLQGWGNECIGQKDPELASACRKRASSRGSR